MAVNGMALGFVAVGSVFVFAGIKGYSIPQTFQDILTGKSPVSQAQTTGISGSGGVVGAGATASGQTIAAQALTYKGAGYVWGGAPAKGTGNWDCSSFVNWVVGHDLGMAIPGYAGGKYDGSVHGPTTLSWLAWNGCTTIGHSASDAVAGDICVWQTHMGIAIGGGQMISAQDQQSGTQVSGIGMPGEILFVRRLNATIQNQPASGGGGKKGK